MSRYEAKKNPGYDTSESRDLFPEDRAIRETGFRIHSRQKGRPPVWYHPAYDIYLPHDEALAFADFDPLDTAAGAA